MLIFFAANFFPSFPGGLFEHGDAEAASQIHATYFPNRTLAAVSHLGASGSNACENQPSSDRQSVVGMRLSDHPGTSAAAEECHAEHWYRVTHSTR